MENEENGGLPSKTTPLTDKAQSLTEAGKRLLDVVINPEARTWSVTRTCEVAGISRDSYYRLFNKDERFLKLYNECCQTACVSQAISVINALAESAKLGDTGAGKIMLEMAGLYQPRASLNLVQSSDEHISLKDILAKRQQVQEKI